MNHYTLKLFATLRKYAPGPDENRRHIPGLMVKTLLEELGIPENEAKLVFINGRRAALDTAVNPGDRVGIFPPVGGG